MDCTRLFELQEVYFESRKDEDFVKLQIEVEKSLKSLIKSTIYKKGGYIGSDKLEEYSYDASMRFMEMYLKNKEWKVNNFQSRMLYEVYFVLFNRKEIKKDKETYFSTMPDEGENLQMNIEEKEDTSTVIEDLIHEHTYWRNVLVDCKTSKTWPKFIRKIAQYSTREWIEDHIIRLKSLHNSLHKKAIKFKEI